VHAGLARDVRRLRSGRGALLPRGTSAVVEKWVVVGANRRTLVSAMTVP